MKRRRRRKKERKKVICWKGEIQLNMMLWLARQFSWLNSCHNVCVPTADTDRDLRQTYSCECVCVLYVYWAMLKETMVHFQPDFLRCDPLYCAFHFRLVVVGSVLSLLLNMCSIVCESAHSVCCISHYTVCAHIYFFVLARNVESLKRRRTILTNMAYGAVVVCVHVSMNFLLGRFEHVRHIHSFANAWTICDTYNRQR